MNLSFHIRVLKPEEFESALSIIENVFPDADVDFDEDGVIIMAEAFGTPVGFVHVIDDGDQILLQGFGVAERYRGLGVGSALMDRFFELYGYDRRPVYLQVLANNPAVELYTKYGFQVNDYGHSQILVRNHFS